ncbi:hypothetical protein SAMN05216475_2946 [Pseudomonas synxantha]|uniref:Uncharacterized protein n=1 Tax=Pseudomonas synxantha TaxID=47883 RepID=A0AAX3I8X0_9PSED|nr:hypothetical protein [Pseudomonas synxantha]AZE66447.1 hypothetical protein C4K01_2252 [Pseudomonas synxantha]KRP51830.1 hypothetical protein TU77_19640 [Pseudomonas synxantha]SDU39939.1 hypothetical protein SAMN05216475_2946 [Pseudomonas synxantha]VTR01168.1 Uncharacterised protein [Pseudomonas synxantha]
MAIKLQMLTEDPKEIELIERYWAVDESGQYLEKVSALTDVIEMAPGVTLASFIRQRCNAFDDNQVCPKCAELIEIKNRSEAKKVPQRSSKLCTLCQNDQDAIALAAKKTKAAELERQLAEYVGMQLTRTVDYSALPDAQVLLLLALDRAVTPRLTNGGFRLGDCRGLAPRYVGDFMLQLREAGLVLDDPSKASPGTYYWKGDEIWVLGDQVVYRLAPDAASRSADEVIRSLSDRVYTDADELFNLWLDYAVADVMRYLGAECELYNHDLSEQELAEIKSTMRAALHTYSVSQLWSVAWKVVRDAASLANREYYNRSKAAATIPGKIRRNLEKVQRESIELKAWSRPEHHPAGTLGMVLGEILGVDENTSGHRVSSLIAWLTGQACSSAIEAALDEPIRELMTLALSHDIGASVMLRFAEMIRAGHDVGSAIEEIGEALRS